MFAGNLSAEEEAEIRRRLAELEDELSVLEAERQVLAKALAEGRFGDGSGAGAGGTSNQPDLLPRVCHASSVATGSNRREYEATGPLHSCPNIS